MMDEKFDSFYDKTVERFEESTSFYPSDILNECPKFRILVVGQTGSGKSTLCSKVFGVGKKAGKVGEPVNVRRINIIHLHTCPDALAVWNLEAHSRHRIP